MVGRMNVACIYVLFKQFQGRVIGYQSRFMVGRGIDEKKVNREFEQEQWIKLTDGRTNRLSDILSRVARY